MVGTHLAGTPQVRQLGEELFQAFSVRDVAQVFRLQCRQSGLGFADPVKEIEWIERPGIGPILGLVLLYEIDAIRRFPEVKNFLSYSRLVLGVHESAGKAKGVGGRKLGNAHLKWAFSEAASLMLRSFAPAKTWMQCQSQKRGVKKAHAILEAKIGRTVFHLWKKQMAFDAKKFLAR